MYGLVHELPVDRARLVKVEALEAERDLLTAIILAEDHVKQLKEAQTELQKARKMHAESASISTMTDLSHLTAAVHILLKK